MRVIFCEEKHTLSVLLKSLSTLTCIIQPECDKAETITLIWQYYLDMATIDTDILISLVRKRPHLWDRGNRLHSNRHVVDKCWKKIAAELNGDENKVRRKWKYLRDQFSVEFGKIPPTGSKEVYEPKWRFYKALQFLEDVVTPRINTRNPRRNGDDSDSDSSSIADSPPPPLESRPKPRYNHRQPDVKKLKVRYVRESQKAKSDPDSVNEEHLHFFKSLLPHVRTIPPHLQLSFRNRVQEVVEEFAYRSDPTATAEKPDFPSNEPYFITCAPDRTKFEPPEAVDECQDNQDDDSS